jgi:hypothetical protein
MSESARRLPCPPRDIEGALPRPDGLRADSWTSTEAANILLRTGRTAEARDALLEVRAVRESPASRELWESLPANLRQ